MREIFKLYLKQELNQVEQERLIPASKLSHSELLKFVMMYSDKKKRFPPSKLIEEKAHGVYKEILKRYSSFREWAENIGYEANQAGHNFWNNSRIIERLAIAIKEHNRLPNNAKGLRSATKKVRTRGYLQQLMTTGGEGIIAFMHLNI